MRFCPDCGLQYAEPKTIPEQNSQFVCSSCLKAAAPKPFDGWPVDSRWVSSARGRGVFASREVTKGEVLERCWVMPISVEEAVASKSLPTLNRYLFPWVDGQRCMLSGEGLLYNFASREVTGRDPNAECAIRRGISAIEFRALRNIREGDEITWDYKKAMTRIH